MATDTIVRCGCPYSHKHSGETGYCLEPDCRSCRGSRECARDHGRLPVLRCAHVGERFVVEMATSIGDGVFVDGDYPLDVDLP